MMGSATHTALVRLPRLAYCGPAHPLEDRAGRPIRLGVVYPYAGGTWECVRLHQPWMGYHQALLRVAPLDSWGFYRWVPLYYPSVLFVGQNTVLGADGRVHAVNLPVI